MSQCVGRYGTNGVSWFRALRTDLRYRAREAGVANPYRRKEGNNTMTSSEEKDNGTADFGRSGELPVAIFVA